MSHVTSVPDLALVDDDELARLYAYPRVDRPWVRVNFVSSLDGAAVGADGRSGSINTESDIRVFAALRALADVVLVGAQTVRTEGYRPVSVRSSWRDARTAQGLAPAPALAVVSRSLDLPDSLYDRSAPRGPVLVITTSDAPAHRMDEVVDRLGPDAVLTVGESEVDLPRCLDLLAERGLSRVLCEGGPTLLAHLASSDLVDDLCLTMSPVMVGGSGPRVMDGPDVRVPLRLAHLIEADSVIFTRWTRHDSPAPSPAPAS